MGGRDGVVIDHSRRSHTMTVTGMSTTPDRAVQVPAAVGDSPTVSGAGDVSSSVVRVGGAGPAGQHVDAGPAVQRYPSPVGELVLIAGPSGLAAVLWPDDERPVRVGAGLDARSLVAEETASPTERDAAPGDDRAAAASSGAAPAGGAAAAGDAAPSRGATVAGAAVPAEASTPAGDTAVVRTLLDEAARQLDEYFAGTRFAFDLPLDPVGTEFQLAVWRSLADIGYGETSTYGEQAARIGRPTAVRAVGSANGRNPLSIVLPCHRVVGRDGRLTGFAGGLEAKEFLLDHEARNRRP
jgi:methylated-DNA-[protein]-cysteine S-methyltransferase